MNFQQLEYILAVDQHRHFAKAADSCHITQATLSAMIKKLEEELGTVIFDRSHQPIKTTDEGEQTIAKAREILTLQSELIRMQHLNEPEISGSLRLGIIPTIANSLLPIILPTLLVEYPKLDLQIIEITTEEIKKQLLNDQIDGGILATPLEEELMEENILYYESMLVYGVNKSDKKFISTDAVKNKNIWLLEEGNCFRNQAKIICDIREKTQGIANLSFEGSSFETLLNLTDKFGGYTLVPELYFNQLPENRKQITRHFEKPMPVREISLVYHRPYARKRTLDSLSEKIIELISGQLVTQRMKSSDLEIVGF
ncbi:MAG: LysR family transcriptional regulator [Cytophagales bacterium]|nr:LysR family transcriptional regulator [Cytophagales bacterium]